MLTEKEIAKLEIKDKRYKVYDGTYLYIDIFPSGKKTFLFKYNNKMEKIGTAGDMAVKEARLIIAEKIAKQKEIILSASSEVVNTKVFLFKSIAEEWIQRKKCSATHLQDTKQKLNKYILPTFGDRNILEITRLEILQHLRMYEAEGKLETCKKVIGIFSMIFDYATNCGYCEINPALRLQSAITTPVRKNFSAFTKVEDITRLMTAIHSYMGQATTKNLLLWSAYTFARPTECRNATWNEIDFDKALWIIPFHRMKNRKEHIIPLPKQCIIILNQLKKMNLSSKWIFPSLQPSKSLSENAVLNALRTMGFAKEEMTAHGFRAMASSTLNSMGFSSDLIEKSLAHTDKNQVRAVYNRADYLEQRRDMLQHYADWLDNLIV